MPRASLRQPFKTARLRPIRRIGSGRLRLGTDHLAPDAAHKPKTITTDPAQRALMSVWSANPATR